MNALCGFLTKVVGPQISVFPGNSSLSSLYNMCMIGVEDIFDCFC